MTTERGSLCDALRRQADRLHGKGHKCPSPPCPFEEEAAELRAAADEIERLRDAARAVLDYENQPSRKALAKLREAVDG